MYMVLTGFQAADIDICLTTLARPVAETESGVHHMAQTPRIDPVR